MKIVRNIDRCSDTHAIIMSLPAPRCVDPEETESAGRRSASRDCELDSREAEMAVRGPANRAAAVRHDYESVGIGEGKVLIAKLS